MPSKFSWVCRCNVQGLVGGALVGRIAGLAMSITLGEMNSPSPQLTKLVDVNYPDRSATTILAGGSGE